MKGSCLCQAVKYQINTTPKDPGCCHCNQCRKQSGHFWAAAFVEDSNLVVSGEVRWYSSSEEAKRGILSHLRFGLVLEVPGWRLDGVFTGFLRWRDWNSLRAAYFYCF